MKPDPIKSSSSITQPPPALAQTNNPNTRTIERSQNSERRAITTQEIRPCHFTQIFFALTSQNVKVIEFKLILMFFIKQGLDVIDIFNLLSANKKLHDEVPFVKDWHSFWTTLDDREIFEPNDAFNSKKNSDIIAFQNAPGRLKFSLKTCYIGMDSGNLQKRIDNTIIFFTDPQNELYLRNCTLFEIYLSQETLNPSNEIWQFVKEHKFKLSFHLELNPSEVKAFDPVCTLLGKLDSQILENVHSFYLSPVIGNKNLAKVQQLCQQLKQCKNLTFFQCGGLGVNTTLASTDLPVSTFKCLGDVNSHANLSFNSCNSTYFKCIDIKDGAAIDLGNLHHFISWDIFHSNFKFSEYKFLTSIKCKQIKASASVSVMNLPNLLSFEGSHINGSLTFGKGLQNLRSVKVKDLTLQNQKQSRLLFSDDLPNLTEFECGDVLGLISFEGNANNLKSIQCGSLIRKEIKAPKPKSARGRSQELYYYQQDQAFNGKLSLPPQLPNLISLTYNDIAIDDYSFDLPGTPKLEKISFGRIDSSSNKIRTAFKDLQKSLMDKNNTAIQSLQDQSLDPNAS